MNNPFVRNDSTVGAQANVQENLGTINIGNNESRLSATFERLEKEILRNTKKEVMDDLLMYKTKLNGTKDLEEKLQDGGFRNTFIQKAKLKKKCMPKSQQNMNVTPRHRKSS